MYGVSLLAGSEIFKRNVDGRSRVAGDNAHLTLDATGNVWVSVTREGIDSPVVQFYPSVGLDGFWSSRPTSSTRTAS